MSNPVRTAFQVILLTFVMATLSEAKQFGYSDFVPGLTPEIESSLRENLRQWRDVPFCRTGIRFFRNGRIWAIDPRNQQTGILIGDVLLEMDGVNTQTLFSAVLTDPIPEQWLQGATKAPGDEIDLVLWRGDRTISRRVVCSDGLLVENQYMSLYESLLEEDWPACYSKLSLLEEMVGLTSYTADWRLWCAWADNGPGWASSNPNEQRV
jgi:hypothetical protein